MAILGLKRGVQGEGQPGKAEEQHAAVSDLAPCPDFPTHTLSRPAPRPPPTSLPSAVTMYAPSCVTSTLLTAPLLSRLRTTCAARMSYTLHSRQGIGREQAR